ncbi:hypothetical protein MHK_003694 [Candidatus Magnetomorum sp. HK-1]|nr:hypothetical protein MHK_003694 [Candidatus Magnetomorum sp. HK-1]
MKGHQNIIGLTLLVIALLYLLLNFTNTKILLSETKINPGQDYSLEDYGNLGEDNQASLVCNYFNGRKTLKKVFWYSPNNVFGKDSCPFVLKD